MRRYIVDLGDGTFGVYVSGYRNSYGTPLFFRGTLDECLAVTT